MLQLVPSVAMPSRPQTHKPQMKQTLYYVEAWSRLSEQRERISAYCSSRTIAEHMAASLRSLRPSHRLYLRPAVKSLTADISKVQ